jgi:hypothetical protein
MPWKMGNRLRLVREQDASPDIRAIFEEIKQTIGLPYIPIIYQAYASLPLFLVAHWERFRPVISSRNFFELGDRLRADAYTRAHNYFDIPDLCEQVQELRFSSGAKEELTETFEQFYYADPLLLLISAAQQQAFEGPTGSATVSSLPVHPEFKTKPVFVDDESASPQVSKIFEETKKSLGLPVVISDVRALARWPGFLHSYWKLLEPLLASPLYQECQFGGLETAWAHARELPGPFELTVSQMTDAGMREDDIASVVRLTQAFTRGLSGSVLNISIAKIGLEGGNHSRQSSEEETEQATKPAGHQAA